MKKFFTVVLSLFLLFCSAPALADPNEGPPIPPTMDLSAIRYIYCQAGDFAYTGSGFLIGDKIMATAFHVAEGEWAQMPKVAPVCYDVKTKTRLVAYKLDINHDFALMTGPGLPTGIPYLTYDCTRPVAGEQYIAYGITSYNETDTIFRNNTVIATNNFSSINDVTTWVEGIASPGMRVYENTDAPGMSGGPVASTLGNIVAINDAGDDVSAQDYDLADTILCNGAPTRT